LNDAFIFILPSPGLTGAFLFPPPAQNYFGCFSPMISMRANRGDGFAIEPHAKGTADAQAL
jgi:hypothetical protein